MNSRFLSKLTVIICLASLAVIMTCASSFSKTPTEDEALKDWNWLEDTHKKLEKKLEATIPSHVARIIGDDYVKILALLEDVEKNHLPDIEKKLGEFAKKYGNNSSEINKSISSIVKLDWRSGKHPGQEAGVLYEKLVKRLKDIPKAKKDKAMGLLRDAKSVQDRIKSFKTKVHSKYYEELKSKLAMALKFDPENKETSEWLKRVDQDRQKDMAAILKKIDEAKWPGHYKNFAGPGDPDEIAASVMEWLRNDEASRNKKDPDHTFKVGVRGDWVSAKKNLLSETIQWGLPIWGACYNKKEKAEDIARVFSLTILTKEEKGVKKAPPWTGVWVGDIFKMHISNVPGAEDNGKTVSGFGRIFWLALFLANIIIGLLLASPLLKSKVPQLAGMYDRITPLSKLIGVISLAVGILCFFRALIFHFAPLADIFPQLTAIVGGLFLGKELLLKKPAFGEGEATAEGTASAKATEAAEAAALKAQEMLVRYEDKINMLETYQVPIGLACIVLGILHMFMGGVTLF